MPVRMFRFASCLLIAFASIGVAVAQAVWPERPIQLIVPFRAGGGVDVIARSFAEVFGEQLRQPVVVIARDGVSGTIGTSAVAATKPHGYTLAFIPHGPITVQPHVIPTLAYKPESLVPLCQVFATQHVLAVRPDSFHQTLAEFIAAAKALPGKVSYGFGGVVAPEPA